jgi:hypothetical protein
MSVIALLKQSCRIMTHDGLENIEKSSPTLEVTLDSSTVTNLGRYHTKFNKHIYKFRYFGLHFLLRYLAPDCF